MKLLFTLITASLFLTMCDSTSTPEPEPTLDVRLTANLGTEANPSLDITLTTNGPVFYTDGNYPTQGNASEILTHWVVWIEKEDGTFIKTLKINKSAPKLNKYGSNKLYTLPTWNAKSNASNLVSNDSINTDDSIYVQFDALTAASLNNYGYAEDSRTVTWDFKDADNNQVAYGTYKYCAEVSALSKLINQTETTDTDTVYQASAYPSHTTFGIIAFKAE